jgi:PAS domain S-box-containing protein
VISELEIAAALDLFEAAPCAYLFTLLDGTITKANETFLQWTGYSSSDLLDRTRPSAIFYETHFSPLLHMQGFIKEITVDFVCADDSHLPALVNSKIQKDGFGNGALVLSSIFDIRVRRKYERELLLERRQAEQWALVVENTSDAIVTADAESALTAWNRGAEGVVRLQRSAGIGQKLSRSGYVARERAGL